MRHKPTTSPWGNTMNIYELAPGVHRVTTKSHGGLYLEQEQWYSLPDLVRDTIISPFFAEEDCEEPIVRTLLGLANAEDQNLAIEIAQEYHRYTPTLPFLKPSTK